MHDMLDFIHLLIVFFPQILLFISTVQSYIFSLPVSYYTTIVLLYHLNVQTNNTLVLLIYFYVLHHFNVQRNNRYNNSKFPFPSDAGILTLTTRRDQTTRPKCNKFGRKCQHSGIWLLYLESF